MRDAICCTSSLAARSTALASPCAPVAWSDSAKTRGTNVRRCEDRPESLGELVGVARFVTGGAVRAERTERARALRLRPGAEPRHSACGEQGLRLVRFVERVACVAGCVRDRRAAPAHVADQGRVSGRGRARERVVERTSCLGGQADGEERDAFGRQSGRACVREAHPRRLLGDATRDGDRFVEQTDVGVAPRDRRRFGDGAPQVPGGAMEGDRRFRVAQIRREVPLGRREHASDDLNLGACIRIRANRRRRRARADVRASASPRRSGSRRSNRAWRESARTRAPDAPHGCRRCRFVRRERRIALRAPPDPSARPR